MINFTLLPVLIGLSIVYLLAFGLVLYRRHSKRIAYTLDSVLALLDQIRAYDRELLERFSPRDTSEFAKKMAQDAEARLVEGMFRLRKVALSVLRAVQAVFRWIGNLGS